MRILREGDTSKALCDSCGSIQGVTFQLKDVPFSDGSGIVNNVMAGVCDVCDTVSVIPHQSTPIIKKQLDKQRKPVEGRVPSHFIDILNLASYRLGVGSDFAPSLIKYYIHALSKGFIVPMDLKGLLKSDLAKGKSNKRISLKGRYVAEEIEVVKKAAHLNTTADLLKIIVLKIHEDILVNQEERRITELKNLAAVVA